LLSEQIQAKPPKATNVMKLLKRRQCNCLNFTNGTKRGRLEIIAEILLLCEQSKALTHNVQNKPQLFSGEKTPEGFNIKGLAHTTREQVHHVQKRVRSSLPYRQPL
jgi:hypothetical protein